MTGLEQWRTARYGIIVDGEFVAIDDADDPRNVETPGARWIGGEHDYQLAQAVAKGALAQKAVPIAVEPIGYIIPTLLKELEKDRDIVLWPKRSGQATLPVYANSPARDASAETDYRAGVEAVAKLLDKKADDYALEYGTDDMGALSFGSGRHADARLEYHSTLIELAEEVRAMIPPAPIASAEEAAKSVATVRVTHKGYAMELSSHVAYALSEGVHGLYAHPAAAQPSGAEEACKLCNSTGHSTPCAYPTEINRQQAKRIAELVPQVETLTLENQQLRVDAELMRQELKNIANADTIEWDDPTQYEAWAKSRARHTLAQIDKEKL